MCNNTSVEKITHGKQVEEIWVLVTSLTYRIFSFTQDDDKQSDIISPYIFS